MPDSDLSDEFQQRVSLPVSTSAGMQQCPLRPHLHGVLKAELTRVQVRFKRCLGHQQTDQVVRKHMSPDLFANKLRSLATQYIHLQSHFQRREIRFIVPPQTIEFGQLGNRGNTRIQDGRDDDHFIGAKAGLVHPESALANGDEVGNRSAFFPVHVSNPRLFPTYQAIVLS